MEFWCEGVRREGKILVDSDFNSAAITDVVLVADTDVADFALAAGGEKGVICAQCGAGPSTYPPAPTLAERTLQRAIEVQHDIAVMECLIWRWIRHPRRLRRRKSFMSQRLCGDASFSLSTRRSARFKPSHHHKIRYPTK